MAGGCEQSNASQQGGAQSRRESVLEERYVHGVHDSFRLLRNPGEDELSVRKSKTHDAFAPLERHCMDPRETCATCAGLLSRTASGKSLSWQRVDSGFFPGAFPTPVTSSPGSRGLRGNGTAMQAHQSMDRTAGKPGPIALWCACVAVSIVSAGSSTPASWSHPTATIGGTNHAHPFSLRTFRMRVGHASGVDKCGAVCRRNLFPTGPSSDGGKPCEPRIGPPYGRGSTHTSARLGTVVSTACMVALSRSKPWHTGNS